MKPYKQHEEERIRMWMGLLEAPKKKELGIECPVPKCGGELLDDSNGQVNRSWPPGRWAKCATCGTRQVVH